MDYEKKYNEMVRRAKELHESGNALTRQQMEIVCPELTESEDERMADMVLKALDAPDAQSCIESWDINPKDVKNWFLANLKKQKEPEPTKCSDDEKVRKFLLRLAERCNENSIDFMGDIKKKDVIAYLEKQKEQKDYRNLYEDIAKSEWFKKAYEGKSLGCDNEQKEQEGITMPNSTELIEMWEKEEAILKEKDFRGDTWRIAQNAFMDGFAKGCGVRQKEQKPELQKPHKGNDTNSKPHWKPSEEQLVALQVAAIESKTDFQTLTSLLIDLKKL